MFDLDILRRKFRVIQNKLTANDNIIELPITLQQRGVDKRIINISRTVVPHVQNMLYPAPLHVYAPLKNLDITRD
ncbi:hypothetical protein N2K86_13905 [Enterobacter mori]|uniref:hypothetical protein n=1 Tax=Enterobacter mori TaxID=539813 RepID=UPI0021B134E3|nr:hypothetical protein [Enterobacter mori]UWX91783.1 hypothetical protein N2K86_13905 [Enterobacter mori]